MVQIVIFSACFGLVFAIYSRIVPAIKMHLNIPPEKRVKPFDCEGCMSFWCALVTGYFTIGIFEAIACAFCAFVLALLIRSHIKPVGL